MQPLNLTPDAPWKQRFRASVVTDTKIATQNPQRGVVISDSSGVFQVYAWDVPSGDLRQITNRPTGTASGHISADGRYLYYFEDQQGNEIGHYVRVAFEGGDPVDLTPDIPMYSTWGLTQSDDGSTIGIHAASDGMIHIYLLKDGQCRQIYHNAGLCTPPMLSADGSLAVVASNERTGLNEYSLIAIDAATGQRFNETFDPQASIRADHFSPVVGDARLLANSDLSGSVRPLIWDCRTGERTDLDLADIPGDVQPFGWSPDGTRVLLQQIHEARQQLYTYELASKKITKLAHPPGSFYSAFFTKAGDIFAILSRTEQPACLVALNGVTGELMRVVLQAGSAPLGRGWRSVEFPSSDGTLVQAWLALPDGDGPFPTILDMHGGPAGVITEQFNARAGAWLDHGFAWLTVNFRGSTTFGKEFERAIWGQMGTLEVEDVVAARKWLVGSGTTEADSILLTGWSYGGYLTLLTLGKYPDLWAGGMAGIAIADWTMLYEDEAETMKAYQRAMFGGTPDDKPDAYAAGSPLTYAGAVKAPILVIQGSNDTRCPPRQMNVYQDQMTALGKSIEVHWFEAGHGSRSKEMNIDHQELMLRFAYRVLG